jgi:hypothetical protein
MPVNADSIRKFATENYVKPARERGLAQFSIPVGPVETILKKAGLPNGRTPLVCASLRGNKFQNENGIVLERWEGPPSGQSTTVVFHFKFSDDAHASGSTPVIETPEERAFRLTEKLRGLLKEEIAAYGGAEGFMRWVRSDDDDQAPA